MALFEAPGWDTGTTPVINSHSFPSKARSKRKRGQNDDSGDTSAPSTPSTATSVNLQKLMRKMELENTGKSGDRSKPSDSQKQRPKSKTDKKKQPALMHPPQSPTAALNILVPSSSPKDSTTAYPPTKKQRIRREDSDVMPPSSAGDDEAESIVSQIKTKKKSKKERKIAAAAKRGQLSSESKNILALPVASDMDTDQTTDVPTIRPVHGRKPLDDDSSSGEFAGLTKLQREMKQKLSGGRFR